MISNMKKNQEINKLSKIRLILASAISIFIFYHCIELIEDLTRVNEFKFSGGNQVNYSDFLLFILLFVGTILFALNRKVTDYISFSIFTFSFGGVLPFQFIDAGCLESPNFNTCVRYLLFSKGTLILLLLGSPLLFLAISFIKRLKE